MNITEDDVDLNASLLARPTQMDATKKQYDSKIREFAKFCHVLWSGPELPPIGLFTDERIAKYFIAMLNFYGPNNSRKKSNAAAINDCLGKLGLKNLFDFAHE